MLRNKKKPLLSALLAVMMTLSLTACGTKAEATKSPEATKAPEANTAAEATTAPEAAKAEPVTINIFQFKVEINDALKEAIATYTAKNPNVTINLETVGGGSDYGAALRAKFDKSTTIYNVAGPQDVQDWMSKLEDLSDQPWVANTVVGTLDGVTKDGKVYGLPYAIEGYGLVYNKEIFEAAGIDGTKLTTYVAMEAAFKDLQKQIDDGKLKDKYPALEAVTELAAKETWITGLHGLNALLNQEFKSGLDSYAAKTVEFKNAEGLKKYFDLQADYSSSAKAKGKLNAVEYAGEVGGGIAIERVAVIQQGNWIYGDVAKIDEAVANKLGILPIPIEGSVEDSIPIGVPNYWAINSEATDAEKTAAKDFLNWLYQSDEGKDIIVNKFLFIPPFTNYDGLEPKDVLGQAIKSYAASGKVTNWVFFGFPTDWGQTVFGAKLQAYFSGEKSFEEVVKESQDEWVKARP